VLCLCFVYKWEKSLAGLYFKPALQKEKVHEKIQAHIGWISVQVFPSKNSKELDSAYEYYVANIFKTIPNTHMVFEL